MKVKISMKQVLEVWKILRPLIQSARKGKKPWLSLSIITNTLAGLLTIFNLDTVGEFIRNDPEMAKILIGGWAGLQVYLRTHTKGQIKLQD